MKHTKRFTALILALVMVFSLTVSASAATAQQVTVKLSPGITVTLNGEAQTMTDVNGNPVYPVLYGGTTYLPVRAVGNMLGLDVDWDQAAQTVLLADSDSGTASNASGTAPDDTTPTDITVSINPGITVKYNGEVQEMKDTNGNPVYPMLYGGTTYLPVRAVSNMLGIGVDWDQATQTVMLTDIVITIKYSDSDILNLSIKDRDVYRQNLKDHGWREEPIEKQLTYFDEKVEQWLADSTARKTTVLDFIFRKGDYLDTKYAVSSTDLDETRKILANLGFDETQIEKTISLIADMADPFLGAETSAGAEVLGENHLGRGWVEIDYSTANSGYVRIKVNEPLTKLTNCQVSWYNKDTGEKSGSVFILSTDQITKWVNIPLWQDSGEYECVIHVYQLETGDEPKTAYRDSLQVRFTAEIDDLDSLWLMSNIKADYENAPVACAKAQELTKNCKTDAEKITAIFNFVSSTLTYDWNLYNRDNAREAAGESVHNIEAERDLNPDSILASKKGVCEHYAVLMTAMLRSLGIPCKYVHGWTYANGESESHTWVAVKPEAGTLNMTALGAGNEGDGWIRLDPTFVSTGGAEGRTAAANDSNYSTINYY